ncbi:MAG: prolyl aminopeptidase, partial [Halocynthiibacter sp.]
NNTTWHLVADIEQIRTTLGIEKWVVFGGSWGAALSLLYAQAHPDRVRHIVLRGVFLATNAELAWFYGGGAGRFWPEQWSAFVAPIPKEERGDLIAAYHKRLFCGDREEEVRHALVWSKWENGLASSASNGQGSDAPAEYARAFARLENHYFFNRAFLSKDGQILADMEKIAHIPGHIVQGRYDMICPPEGAWQLAARWPGSKLQVVPMAGHALSEPDITSALVQVMNGIGKAAGD